MVNEHIMTMDFETVADELYGLRPDEFTATRNERAGEARASGQRDLAKSIGQLRKPTTGAWVVNLLAREDEGEVDQLVQLGEQLREAQSELKGDLRSLSQRRTQVVSALADEGRRLAREAGHPVSEGIGREVASTLEAALADPDAAAEVRSGRLTGALSYSGLGPLGASTDADTGQSAATTTRAKTKKRKETPSAGKRSAGSGRKDATADEDRKKELDEAQRALSDARQEADQVEQSYAQARGEADDARSRRGRADEQVSEREAELERARGAAARAAEEQAAAEGRREEAARSVSAAQDRVEQAQTRVDKLRAT